MSREALQTRGHLDRDRTLLLVVAGVALLATLVRLYALGQRVFYYDEAWLGYWVLRSMDSGVWYYRPIVHGPFFARVNPLVYALFGVSDASARLVVALVGGALPLGAWLFRERLRDVEVVALAVVLALNPILVYYSRFRRNDLLLAAFALFAAGFVVRVLDTGRERYVYSGAVFAGLAFTTKESALLYVVTAVGAGVLVFDDRAMSAAPPLDVRARIRQTATVLRDWARPLVGATLTVLVVVVYFYAPRPEFGRALLDPTLLPGVIGAATLGSLRAAVDYWVAGGIQDHAYLPYLLDTLQTLAAGASAVCVLGVVGFVADRYGGDRREVVSFAFYAGVAAVVGYPLANNFPVPWSTVHAVVPLAVPAAVGVGVVYRWGRQIPGAGLRSDPRGALRAGLVAVVLVGAVLNAGLVVVETSYRHPHESPRGDGGNELVYYAQAPGNLSAGVAAIRRATRDDRAGADVLFVGESLAMNESADDRPRPPGAWYARMPLPWYLESTGAEVRSVPSTLGIGEDPPPVVVAEPEDRAVVARRLPPGYTARNQPLDDIGDRRVVFFVHDSVRGDS